MHTINTEIIDKKALDLLKELEQLKLIRIRKDRPEEKFTPIDIDCSKYKGAMSK